MTAPATIQRRLLGTYLREGLLGAAFDDTTYCPVAIPGVDFDPENANDTTPFTPAQVRDECGYIELTLREGLEAQSAGITSGVDEATGDLFSRVYVWSRARFTIRVPATDTDGVDLDVEGLLEIYAEKLVDLFFGLRIVHAGPPKVYLQHLTTKPPTVWGDTDDGAWRRRDLDFLIRRQEHQTHAGVQAVTLAA